MVMVHEGVLEVFSSCGVSRLGQCEVSRSSANGDVLCVIAEIVRNAALNEQVSRL